LSLSKWLFITAFIFGCSENASTPVSSNTGILNSLSSIQVQNPNQFTENLYFNCCEDAADMHKAAVDSALEWYSCGAAFYANINAYCDSMLNQHFPGYDPDSALLEFMEDFATNYDSLWFVHFQTSIDTAISITRGYLHGAVNAGGISNDIGSKADHILDLCDEGASYSTINSAINLLVDYTDLYGTELEMLTVGVLYGSWRDYYSTPDYWQYIADFGGACLGAALTLPAGGAPGAALGATCVSSLYSEFFPGI